MRTKRYIGMKKALRGKTALVQGSKKPGEILAQFDDMNLVYRNKMLGYNWHAFKVEEFQELDA